ncbi:TraC family protein [Geoalkalibacter sp.]|uniref:TraC family protein n=1 Tax=Geoalkalibacter sp. TaxID=3041440 RepID=UPI00272DEFD5|nr:TraC family protein [Geoalkalibacter sp.]
MLFTDFKSLLFGKNGGLKLKDLDTMSKTNPFSEFLPFNYYDPETQVYLLQDDAVGFLWEATPLVFAGDRALCAADGIYGAGLPDYSVLGFHLHADSHIDPYLEAFETCHPRQHPMVHEWVKNFSQHCSKGRWGLEQASYIPFRNFRLFISAKIPQSSPQVQGSGWEDLRQHLEETLAGCGLRPKRMAPPELLDWMRRLFNDENPQRNSAWDENIPLRKQIIRAETEIREHADHIHIGNKVFKAITPKVYPRFVDPIQTNELFGGFMGLVSDQDQIRTPFLYSLNLIWAPLAKTLHGKCNFVLQQQAVGSIAPSLQRKQAEYLSATDKLEKGIPFIRVMPIFWIWGKDRKEALESASRVRRIWESHNFQMQVDRGILKILLIASLPFGLYPNKGKTLDNLQRDIIVDTPAVSPTLPIQGDFRGVGAPKILLFGRKGQVAPLDFWAKGVNAHNGLLLATTGSGKSFFSNFLVGGEYAAGARIRIMDIGFSYKKSCDMFGGRMIDLTPERPMSLNPFTNVKDPAEDLEAVVGCAVLMAFAANPQEMPDTIENNLLRDAVRYAWQQRQNQADSGLIYEYLANFATHHRQVQKTDSRNLAYSEEELCFTRVSTPVMVEKANHLAYQMKEFTPWGQYGPYFSGPSTFNIRDDEFVVTELQNIQPIKELYRVVVGLVMNAYLQDTYQKKDLSQQTLCVFDEAWQYLKVGATDGGIGNQIAPVLERFARTCRKQNTGILVISQSIQDMYDFGASGKAIWGNTPFKVFLESPDFGRAAKEGLLEYDDFTMSILRSIKGAKPRYSELFIDTPLGRGAARLMVDPFTYFMCTSDATENAQIYRMVEAGLSFHEAIYEMVRKYRS